MLLEGVPGFCVPDLSLVVGEVLPGQADDLGESAVVSLDLRGDVLSFDEGRAEKNERIGWAGDMVLWLLLGVG